MRGREGLGTLDAMTNAATCGVEWLSALGEALLAREPGAAIAARLGAVERTSDDRVLVALGDGAHVTLLLDGGLAHQAWIDPEGRAPSLVDLEARWGVPRQGPRTGPFAPVGLTFLLAQNETTEVRLLVHIRDETAARAEWTIRDMVVLRQSRLR